ncbi:hypothetical protein [Nostoc sp. MS1]|nr:hypothetical protein [Nostoc sp. MS1]
MNELDALLSQFHSTNHLTSSTNWSEQQQEKLSQKMKTAKG